MQKGVNTKHVKVVHKVYAGKRNFGKLIGRGYTFWVDEGIISKNHTTVGR